MSLQSSDSITLRINGHAEIMCFLDTLTFFLAAMADSKRQGEAWVGGTGWGLPGLVIF